MRRYILSLCLLCGSYSALSAETIINETKTKLEQWVETKQILSKEKSDWDVDKEFLLQTQELLKTELESLEAQVKELEDSNTEADKEREGLLLQRAGFFRSDKVLAEQITTMEREALAIIKQFPVPLKSKLEPLIVRIPEDPEKTKLALGQRLQNVVGILSQAEKFDKTATLVGETRSVSGGKEVQVTVIYWGLSCAFYSDTNGTLAGVGTPSSDGWVWTERNDAAEDIKYFIDIYEGNVDTVEFVSLPITIQ